MWPGKFIVRKQAGNWELEVTVTCLTLNFFSKRDRILRILFKYPKLQVLTEQRAASEFVLILAKGAWRGGIKFEPQSSSHLK